MDESLNETLQEDASRNRALALYEGTRGDDLVSEEVDERILKLLGLDDVFDIDYATYMSLLRGKMAEARMVDKKLSTDETMLITDEFKRVKGKVGRFKLKRKKITAENLGVTGPVRVSKQQYFLTSKAIVPEVSGTGEDNSDLLKNLIVINNTFSKILDSIRNQNKLIKKSEETDRKKREEDQRKKREEGLEKGLSKIASVASKMLAPVQGILDKILNFILYTLLGRAFVKFIDWFNDPKNKEKVEVLKRFLKDWWPTLLGALVLFTTPFGKFVRGFIGTVTKLSLRLARFAIPKLLSFVKANPKAAALLAAGTAAVGAGIYMQSQREQRDKELQGVDPNYGKKPGPMKSIIDFGTMGGMQFKGGGMIPLAKAFTGGGEQLQPFGSGYVDEDTGITVTGAGADTQATVLQPGEVVFSKPAVDYWGADRLLAMNKMGGGTNIPKFVNNVQMAQGGGMIGKASHHLKQDEALSSLSKGMNDFIKPGGRSVISKINWGNIKPETPVHSYVDSVGQPTIGWGSTFYDSILSGKKPVRMGDSITKKQADGILNTNLGNLAKTYSQKIPLWKKMSDNQKAGVLTLGYNAPYGPIGAFPKLTDALMRGDMQSAAANIQRSGPSSARLSIEKQLLLSGPKDLTKAQQPPKAELKPKEPSLFDKVKSNVMNFFNPKPTTNIGPPISSMNQNIIELPPIVQQSGQQVATAGGTKVPQFMSPDTTYATINASIYGIG
jgi:GH24 family phage-related lysozyme (muramidase)